MHEGKQTPLTLRLNLYNSQPQDEFRINQTQQQQQTEAANPRAAEAVRDGEVQGTGDAKTKTFKDIQRGCVRIKMR